MQRTYEEPCEHSSRRGGLLLRGLVVGTGVIGTLLMGGGVMAAWSPSTSLTSGSYGAADLAVQMVNANGTTFSAGVSNLLPGDYMNRYADLTNNGSVAQTFQGTITGAGTLANALTVKVDNCSVAWAVNGTCSGTTTAVKAATSTAAPVTFSTASMAVNELKHLRFRFELDSAADQATYQGTTATQQISIVGSSTVPGGQDRTAG
jgi:hypothetical protein